MDETGENKTEYEYTEGTNLVKTAKSPNGGKFGYGRDLSDRITAITQSTEDGEENSTTTKYTCGVVTELRSGLNTVNYEYDHKRRKTKVVLNGNDHIEYAYDENNDTAVPNTVVDIAAATLKDGKNGGLGTTSERIIDKRGNLLEVSLDGVAQVTNTYDGEDRILTSTDQTTGSVVTYTYDPVTKRVDSVSKSAGSLDNTALEAVAETYTYNEYGQLDSKTVSVDNAVVQEYAFEYKNNAARELESITLPNDLVYKPQRDVNGRNTGKLLEDSGGTLFGEYITYRKVGDHGTNQVSAVRYGTRKDGKLQLSEGIKYAYDKNGNIEKIYGKGGLTTKYTYDALNRLTREDNKALNKTYLYEYDNNGNILSKRETGFTLSSPLEGCPSGRGGNILTYVYDGDHSDRLAAITRTSASGKPGGTYCGEGTCGGGESLSGNGDLLFEYDAIGNPTLYKGISLTWQKGRQLGAYDTGGINLQFVYDGYGKRVAKDSVVYTYTGDKLLMQSDGTDTLEFIHDGAGLCGVTHTAIITTETGDPPVISTAAEKSQYLYRRNIQGDITHIFDTAGNCVVKYSYDAWGNHRVVSENGALIYDSTLGVTPGFESHIGNLNAFRYRGYYFDTETKLYYLKSRYYDPQTGRFINADSVDYLAPGTINGLNLYAYCGNNPVMRADPTGCAWKWWQVLFIILTLGAYAKNHEPALSPKEKRQLEKERKQREKEREAEREFNQKVTDNEYFLTENDAYMWWAGEYSGRNVEYGAMLYKKTYTISKDNKRTYYYFGKIYEGGENNVVMGFLGGLTGGWFRFSSERVAFIHLHPDGWTVSSQDKWLASWDNFKMIIIEDNRDGSGRTDVFQLMPDGTPADPIGWFPYVRI